MSNIKNNDREESDEGCRRGCCLVVDFWSRVGKDRVLNEREKRMDTVIFSFKMVEGNEFFFPGLVIGLSLTMKVAG